MGRSRKVRRSQVLPHANVEFPMNAQRRSGTCATDEQDNDDHLSIQWDCLGRKSPLGAAPR
eukprot:9475141-Pyramimonas_sp.AAC.1